MKPNDLTRMLGDVEHIFGAALKCCFIGGSVAAGTSRQDSDIDVFVCVDTVDADQLSRFRSWYFDLHRSLQRRADLEFPGEVVSLRQLEVKLLEALAAPPQLAVNCQDTLDALVWAGLLSGPRLGTRGDLPSEIWLYAQKLVRTWNHSLFGDGGSLSAGKLKRHVMLMPGDSSLAKAAKLAQCILDNRAALYEALVCYESKETTTDQIDRSLDCLLGLRSEQAFLQGPGVNRISSFLPVNLPLYSLVLFGFIPGLMSKEIHVRAPVQARSVLHRVAEMVLDADQALTIYDGDRGAFVKGPVANSDVVLFTGQYPNARRVERSCSRALFLYNGAGINPIVIAADADLPAAVTKTVAARVFNSGQDCAGPDSILVEESVHSAFLMQLQETLRSIRVGDYEDPAVRVGRIVNQSTGARVAQTFEAHRDAIIEGGRINHEKNIVYPTIIDVPLCVRCNYDEFFAPVFWLSRFKEGELPSFFDQQVYHDHAMYVTVFGSVPGVEFSNSVTLENRTILEVEQGNSPYGGYGPKANYVATKGERTPRPLLISREIRRWLSYA